MEEAVLYGQLPRLLDPQQPAYVLFSHLHIHLLAEELGWFTQLDARNQPTAHLSDARQATLDAGRYEALGSYAAVTFLYQVQIGHKVLDDVSLFFSLEGQQLEQLNQITQEGPVID